MGEKIFQDTRTQIGILRSRGLVIKNKRFAKQIIRDCNYYNLINGYKDPFIITGVVPEQYMHGTQLEEIYALYEFDRKLRALTLKFILEIEKRVKSLISYSFSKVYGHKDYLRVENFETGTLKKYKQVCDLLNAIYKKITFNIDKDPSISHYVGGKNYIPLWVLVNCISMGDISKFYCNMKHKQRHDVAKRMKYGIKEDQLKNALFFLSAIRNRCAHDERLYSYTSNTYLMENKYFDYFHISHDGVNNYFAVMIAFKMILSEKRYADYQSELEQLLNELSINLKSIPIKKIRNIMGLPRNWKKLKTLK